MEFLDSLAMTLLGQWHTWMMHRLANLIHTKWHGQQPITAATHLDKLRVLHRSEHFLVVNKHEDLVMNTNPGDDRLSLADQLKHRFPSLYQPGLGHGFYILHRLDYSTSGVLVVPLSKKAAAQGSKALEARRGKKYYLALLRGRVEGDRVDIDIPIGKDPDHSHRMATPTDPGCTAPRAARTRLVVMARGKYSGGEATKVLLAPITGRRHQLRLHCHRLGHTIVGDWTYSDKRDVLPPRMYLHAHRLVLDTALERLDVSAGDPFTQQLDKRWTEEQHVNDLNSATNQIHNENLDWMTLNCDSLKLTDVS